MEREKTINIIVAGIGGQGNILISQIISEAALRQGFDVVVGEIFGVSQRGGPVSSHIRIGKERETRWRACVSTKHQADIICSLEPMEALRVAIPYIGQDGIIVTNTHISRPISVNLGKATYPEVSEILTEIKQLCKQVIAFDATELSLKAGSSLSTNIACLGALSCIDSVGLESEAYESAIRIVSSKFAETNLKVFQLSRERVLRENERRS